MIPSPSRKNIFKPWNKEAVSIFHLKGEYDARNDTRFTCYSPLYHVTPLKIDWNYRLTIDVFKGALMTRYFTTLLLAYSNAVKTILSHSNVSTMDNNWSNLAQTMEVICMQGTVYVLALVTLENSSMTPGIGRLIKPVVEKMIKFPEKSTHSCYN